MLPIQSLNLSNNRTRCKEIHECYITFKYILYIISYEIIFSSGKLGVDIISNCTWQKTEVCTMHGEQEMYCWASLAPTSSYSSLGCFKAIQLTPLSICINIWRFVDGQSINNEFIHEWPNYSPFTKYYKIVTKPFGQKHTFFVDQAETAALFVDEIYWRRHLSLAMSLPLDSTVTNFERCSFPTICCTSSQGWVDEDDEADSDHEASNLESSFCEISRRRRRNTIRK